MGLYFYITEFTSNVDITNVYKVFASELAKALNTNYKTIFDDYKLVVKKRGSKFYFDSENYKTITGSYARDIMILIFLGILLMIGAMFYFRSLY